MKSYIKDSHICYTSGLMDSYLINNSSMFLSRDTIYINFFNGGKTTVLINLVTEPKLIGDK